MHKFFVVAQKDWIKSLMCFENGARPSIRVQVIISTVKYFLLLRCISHISDHISKERNYNAVVARDHLILVCCNCAMCGQSNDILAHA